MPLAYLADPWQKMKVEQEMEVNFFKFCCSLPKFFNFEWKVEAHSNFFKFPFSQVADEEMTDVNKNGVSWFLSILPTILSRLCV